MYVKPLITAISATIWPDHPQKLYTFTTVHIMKLCKYVKASDNVFFSISVFMTLIQPCVMFFCSDIGLQGIVYAVGKV